MKPVDSRSRSRSRVETPADAPAAPAVPKHRGKGEVRIIGGLWKRTRLQVPDLPGLRPTPDRVRETLFNWLGQDLTGWRCLDAFAGTGALGLEAASRGAKHVMLCERQPALVDALRAARTKLKATAVEVRRADGIAALRDAAPGSLDLVLLDPPFDAGLFDAALAAAARAVAPTGRIYLEAPRACTEADLQALGLAVSRHLRAGAVHAHLLVVAAAEPAAA